MEMTRRVRHLIEKAHHIVISTHENPDADGIGSQIALCLALRTLGKNAICVNEECLFQRYSYLDSQEVVLSLPDYLKTFSHQTIDLFIGVDTHTPSRLGPPMQELLKTSKNFIFIDHHPCPPAIAAIHCVDTSAAATGELVGRLILSMGIPLTREMALPLYTSILIDTSSFRYPTVSGETHRLLGRILDTGVRPAEAYNKIYGTKKLSHLKLLGSILSRIESTDDEQIAWIIVNQKLLDQFGTHPEDTHSFINHLLILDNIKVACMFRDVGKWVKISFRSVGNIDVGELAEALGGGGHNHSAATTVEGELATVVPDTIEKLKVMLKTIGKSDSPATRKTTRKKAIHKVKAKKIRKVKRKKRNP